MCAVAPAPFVRQLSRYFAASDGAYSVIGDLVRRVRFRELNLLRHPFDPGCNVVICRNIMIYFSDEVNVNLARRFMDLLTHGGALFIGATEALLDEKAAGFERVGGSFYRKSTAAAAGLRSERTAA